MNAAHIESPPMRGAVCRLALCAAITGLPLEALQDSTTEMRLRSRKSVSRCAIFVRSACFDDGERMTRYIAVFGGRFGFFLKLRGPCPFCVTLYRSLGDFGSALGREWWVNYVL